MRRLASILLLFAAGCGPAFAATYNLDATSNWQGIVEAFTGTNAAIFEAGTYQVTNGKAFTLPANTTITGAGPTSSYIVAAATNRAILATAANIVISGFNVSGGNPSGGGGGILGSSRSTTVSNCIVASNTATFGGGLAHCNVYDSTVYSNRASSHSEYGSGGGIYLTKTNGIASGCYVSNNVQNSSDAGGAGISAGYLGSTAWVLNSTVVVNRALAGISAGTYGVNLSNSLVSANHALAGANGGSGAFTVPLLAIGSTFSGNLSSSSGGGTHTMRLSNCLVVGNVASNSVGGGIFQGSAINSSVISNRGSGASTASLTNCIVSGNVAIANGNPGGISASLAVGCTIENNVGNNSAGGAAGSTLDSCVVVSNTPWAVVDSIVRNCTVIGHTSAVPAIIMSTTSKIVANTLLWNNASNLVMTNAIGGGPWSNVAANALGVDPLFLTGTYVPQATNIVDSGIGTYAVTANDWRGLPRTSGAAVDIGAVEFTQTNDVAGVASRIKLMLLGVFQ